MWNIRGTQRRKGRRGGDIGAKLKKRLCKMDVARKGRRGGGIGAKLKKRLCKTDVARKGAKVAKRKVVIVFSKFNQLYQGDLIFSPKLV